MVLKVSIMNNGKWIPIGLKDFLGSGFIDFAVDSIDPVVVAIYETTDDESLMLIVANTDNLKDHYREQGIPFVNAGEMQILLSENKLPAYVSKVFPDAEFIEVKTVEATKDEGEKSISDGFL